MRRALWRIAAVADIIVLVALVMQFDARDMIGVYIGALACIGVLVLLLAVGWQWVMEDDDRITDLWEYRDGRR